MVILFLAALILAWPTAGLSIVAYIVFLVARGYLQGKAISNDINKEQAMRDLANGAPPTLPSWATDSDKAELFLRTLAELVPRKGVAESYVAASISNKDTLRVLLVFAGQLERRGSSFTEQQVGTAELMEKMWGRLDGASKLKFLVGSS